MKLAFPLMVLLAIITAVGSYFQLVFVSYLVSASVICVIILVFLKKIPEKTYPVYLVGLALSMIWQQTMLGSYIVGTDIHQEYYMVNRTIANGWDWSYWSLNGTSVVLNVITPLLDRIGISVLWQFKLLYPLILAFVPLILYVAFAKQIGKKYGFYSVIFFIIVPVFTVEIATITKSMVADFFFALIILVLFTSMRFWYKFILLSVIGVVTILCHYTVGTLVFGYLAITGLILIPWGIITHRFNFLPICSAVLVIGVIGGLWFYNTGGGIVYLGYTNSYTNVVKQMSEIDLTSQKVNYLDQQDSLIRTALGMDWNKTSLVGKLFRVIQYITQLGIILGMIVLILKRKQYKVSICFIVGILASVIVLVCVLFVPKIASIINTTRWYHSALFFASPLLIIGLLKIGKEKLVVGVLLVYYLFTSGLVYTLAHSDIPQLTLESPYSVAYNWKQGIIGVFNEDDVNCAKWLQNKIDGNKVHMGFTDMYLMMGYVEYDGQFVEYAPKEPHYLFITSQNIELEKMTVWTEPGMRKLVDLPDIKNMKEIYRQGKSVVYYGQ